MLLQNFQCFFSITYWVNFFKKVILTFYKNILQWYNICFLVVFFGHFWATVNFCAPLAPINSLYYSNMIVSVSVSVSAEIEKYFRFQYRFRPKRKMALSVSFGFGRNEKKPFGRTLETDWKFQIRIGASSQISSTLLAATSATFS